MDAKEKKAFLEQYRHLQDHITGLTAEIEKWQTIGEKVNNALGIGGGSNLKQSKVEKSAVNVADIITDIQTDIDKAREKRKEIEKAIDSGCKWFRHKEILKMRYINGLSVSKIARMLHKEDKTVSNMISSAIKDMKI